MPTVKAFSDLDADRADIARRRKMAEMLQAQGMQPVEQQMAGGYVVPTSWTQGLAKALQAGMGGYQQSKLREEEKALAQRSKDEFGQWAQGMPQPQARDLNLVANDDEGNAMPPATQTTQPTKQQMLAWALQGAGSGNPMAAQLASPMLAQALKQDEDYTLGEGQRRYRGGSVIAEGAPRTFRPPDPVQPKTPTPMAPGRTRDVQIGDQKVTQELQQDGTWKEIGRGPAFARSVAPVVNNNQPAPVTPVTIQDPQNPNATIIVDGRTGARIGAGPKLTETGRSEYKRQFNAQGIGGALQQAEDLLIGQKRDSEGNITPNDLPTGSGVGSVVDSLANVVGVTPKGAKEAADLKVVSGKLISTVPRFEGPQSDKDMLLYKQMAGDAGNEKLTRDVRLSAIRKMRELYSRYETGQVGRVAPTGGASGGWSVVR